MRLVSGKTSYVSWQSRSWPSGQLTSSLLENFLGVYNLDTIENDFKITIKEVGANPIFELMEITAKAILKNMPDNKARDISISNLLHSALFLKFSIIEEAKRLHKQSLNQTDITGDQDVGGGSSAG